MATKKRKTTQLKKRTSILSKLMPNNIVRAMLFVAVFALLGGGYYLYKTLAANPTGVSGTDYFGMSRGNLQWMDDATRRAKLDEIKSLGVRWMRIDIMWSNIQYDGPNSYNWTVFDKLVDDINARGIKIMADITYTPPWALPDNMPIPIDEAHKAEWEHYAPKNPSDYANFAKAVAKHYGNKINYYEIWNEANNYDFFKPKPDAPKYAAMLKGAHLGIKSANPNAVTISSGLAPYGEPGQVSSDGRLVNPVTFVQRMYQNGVKGYFDALGWHPYNWGSGPPSQQKPWNAWYQMYGTTPSALSVMKDNGEPDKKIWMTEWGYPSIKVAPNIADEALQAQYLKEGYELARSYSWAGPLFWFTQEDWGDSTTNPHNAFGLKRKDGTRKPSFAAYKEAVSDARGNLTVSVVVPSEKSIVAGDTVFAAVANASDGAKITKVEFYVNSLVFIGNGVNYLGWNLSWNTKSVADGTYSVVAKAFDSTGRTTISKPINLMVKNGSPPKANIVVPAPTGNTYISGTKVVMSAASNEPSQVPWMWYYMDNKEIGTAVPTGYGYLLQLDTTKYPNGPHTFHVKAQYLNGYTFVGPSVTYNIQN